MALVSIIAISPDNNLPIPQPTPYLLRYLITTDTTPGLATINITNHGAADSTTAADLQTDMYPSGPLFNAVAGLPSGGTTIGAFLALVGNPLLRISLVWNNPGTNADTALTTVGIDGFNDTFLATPTAGLTIKINQLGAVASYGILTIEFRHSIEQ
jgi:hypothetical protein